MQKLKVAVVGVGSLGKEHARIYAELASAGKVDFVGVFDSSTASLEKLAEKVKVRRFATIDELSAAAEAISVVTPTVTHFELASKFLKAGKHVLVEKPMTDNAAQAADLVRLAQDHKCVLQVGHVERFNPVLGYLEK